jgi:hypothetical protein
MKIEEEEKPFVYEEKFIPNLKKEYENIYNSKHRDNLCKIEKISNDIGVDEKEYRKMFRGVFKKYQEVVFDSLVKYYWLSQKFIYGGTLRGKYKHNGNVLDASYGLYIKKYVGYNNRFLTQACFSKVTSFLDSFFPDLMAENPFEKKFKFPYKYIKFECLHLVAAMPERMEILNYCEKKKMSYSEFVDYVCNYISVINERTGKEIFILKSGYELFNLHVQYEGTKKIKTGSVCGGEVQQLPQSEPVSTEPITESDGNNPGPENGGA